MRVLLISSDRIDTHMAGPGIRYWEFAKQLSATHDVTLLTPNRASISHARFQIVQRTRHTLSAALKEADVIATQGYLFPLAPLLKTRTPLALDFYDPLPIEILEHHATQPLAAAQLSQSYCVARTKLLLQRGDYFLCSHERQRDFWLGMLSAVGRVDHAQYRHSPSLSHLFGEVPYGIQDEPPQSTGSILRRQFPRIAESDTILLWGGGIWRWFDPCSVIRAMREIADERPDIKLVLLGGKSADNDQRRTKIASAAETALTLAKETELYQRTVFFYEQWIPYRERQNYLPEADIGISTHFDNLETRFAFRTRILDYLWAELPIMTTRGDYLSDLVEQEQLGLVVEPENVQQIRAAILRLSDDRAFRETCRQNIRRVRQRFFWSRVIEPLHRFCEQPYRTSHLSGPARWAKLAQFYGNTAGLLIKYRGYKKILARLLRY